MKIVTCTLPNASTLISGVVFSESDSGMVSDAVTDEVAAQFEGIPGYTFADSDEAQKTPAKAGKASKVPEAPKDQADQAPKE